MYNILLGGAAGDGMETLSTLLEKLFKQAGFFVFTTRDVMSRVRGGHNFVQIRFGESPIGCHSKRLDGMFAMNAETFALHQNELADDGFVICDTALAVTDKRVLALPLMQTAKELGNEKVLASVAAGAILALFQMDIAACEQTLARIFKPSLVKINHAAILKGYAIATPRNRMNPQSLAGHMLVSGTNALTLGAIAAGLQFYAAYPMSPSTGILEYLSQHGEKLGIVVEQAEDEIAAVNMAIGAAYAGIPAMTGTSGGGFSLMVEALGFAGIAEIPLVIADVQRPGPATGLPTRTEQSDLKFVISASQGEFPRMVIALRSHEDAFYQTARAFGLAKKYQMPVILLSDQYLGDSTATVPVFDLEKIYTAGCAPQAEIPYKSYAMTSSGISPRLFPGKSNELVHADSDEHDEYGFITESAQVRRQMVDKRMGKLALLCGACVWGRLSASHRTAAALRGKGPYNHLCGAKRHRAVGRTHSRNNGDPMQQPDFEIRWTAAYRAGHTGPDSSAGRRAKMVNHLFSTTETAWCPGCGNFAILSSLAGVLQELALPPSQVVLVGGIGQAAKTNQYVTANGFSGLHGRALPAAVGIKLANSQLTVIVNTGDGDSYGEGGNHFLHNIRRNVDISHFVHNNQIYGLAKGQTSPTSDACDIEHHGACNMSTPFNPMLLAIAAGATFVARGFSGNPAHLAKMMKAAIAHKGYALVDILQPCITFNKVNTYAYNDDSITKAMQESYPLYADNFPIWAEQANGMLQFAIWNLLESEGLGANLQHYNPLIDEPVRAAFAIAKSWRLIAQMPFGVPTAQPAPKEFADITTRVKVLK